MASTTPPNQTTIHLLSKKSEKLQRNTFFFLPNPQGWLIAGLNQRLTPVNCAKLNRWAKICDPDCSPLELFPVQVMKFGILKYITIHTGPSIPPESTALLQPGDYSWVAQGTSRVIPLQTINPDEMTFVELTENAQLVQAYSHLKEYLPFNDFPPDLGDIVTLRDEERCVITGTKGDVGVTWIFPPAWSSSLYDIEYRDPSAIRIPSNAILMKRELIEPFQSNAFGIDVDDNYRVVVFSDIGPVRKSLPEEVQPSFKHASGSPTPYDDFLRMHFRHCLIVHLVGGDIGRDYPGNLVWETMDDLGINPSSYLEDHQVDTSDPLWQTPLGKEIFEDYTRNLLAAKLQDAEAAGIEADED